MKYFLAVDCGGTKIASVVFDETLKIHEKTEFSGGANAKTLSSEVLNSNIRNALTDVKNHLGDKKIEKMYGFFMHNESLFAKHGEEILDCGDVTEIPEGALGVLCGGIYPDGALLLCGTGGDVFVIKNGSVADIIGGWGAILGEKGSGFAIGKAAINCAIAYHEGTGPYTVLYDRVKEKFPAESFRQSVYGIYRAPETVREVAGYAIDVEKAAENGDGVALGILDTAAHDLSDMVITAYRKNLLPDDFPLTFSGGVIKHDISRTNPLMFGKICSILKEHGITNINTPLIPPVYGGMLYYAYTQKMPVTRDKIREYFPDAVR